MILSDITVIIWSKILISLEKKNKYVTPNDLEAYSFYVNEGLSFP